MKVRIGLAIAVALQTAVLISMIGMKQWTLSTGTEVLLETRPIDPRSLFRGDYVRLNFSINSLPSNLPGTPKSLTKGEAVYVALRQQGELWHPVSVHLQYPEPVAGTVIIKGEARHSWRPSRTMPIKYGIEEFFVPEGEGRAIERPPAGSKVNILVAIDKYGNAGIKAILLDGVPFYDVTLF